MLYEPGTEIMLVKADTSFKKKNLVVISIIPRRI